MKICHITSVHYRYDGRIFKKEAVSLSKKYNTYLLCNDELENEVKCGVKFVSTNFTPKNRIERFLLSNKKILIKALEIDADIYHLHDPELLNIALKLKKKNKIVIFDSHEDYPSNISQKKWIPKYLRKLVSIMYEKKEKFVLKKIDAVVTVTTKIMDRIKKINKNTILITNYPILNNNYGRKHNGKTLCFAGGISKQWMHNNVIEAIKDLDVKYIIAGNNNSSYFESLKTLDGFEKVEAIGKISSSEVEDLYSRSTIGIALNDYVANVGFKEGSLGNTKIFEYMMAGLPLVATDFKVWKNIINKNNCGICVNPNDINEIKKAIEYLINNPKEAKKMGQNGRKLIEEKYNWETQEKELYKLYKKLEESYEKNSNSIRS